MMRQIYEKFRTFASKFVLFFVKKQNTSSSQWLSDVFFDVFLDCRDGAESEVFDKYFQHTLRNEARKCGTDVDILHVCDTAFRIRIRA